MHPTSPRPYIDTLVDFSIHEDGSKKRSLDEKTARVTKQSLEGMRPNEGLKKHKVVRFCDDQDGDQNFDEVIDSINNMSLKCNDELEPHSRYIAEGSQYYDWLEIGANSSFQMTDEDFIWFANRQPFTKLSFPQGNYITDKAFICVLEDRRFMHTIEIGLCPNLTDKTLFAIARYCPNLVKLSLFACPHITYEGVLAVVKMCPTLKVISFDCCPLLRDAAVYATSIYCKGLTEFGAAECEKMTIEAFTALVTRCQSLEKLNLWGCSQITDEWVDVLIASGRKIKELDIEYCEQITPFGLRRLLSHFPEITYESSIKGVQRLRQD